MPQDVELMRSLRPENINYFNFLWLLLCQICFSLVWIDIAYVCALSYHHLICALGGQIEFRQSKNNQVEMFTRCINVIVKQVMVTRCWGQVEMN